MIVTLKDGSFKEYDKAMTVYEIAADISEGLARVACAGELNGKVVDLRTEVNEDCSLNILTANDEGGLQTLRHTTAHVMAAPSVPLSRMAFIMISMQNLFPERIWTRLRLR